MRTKHYFRLTLVLLLVHAGMGLPSTPSAAPSADATAVGTIEQRIRDAPDLSDTDRACMLDNFAATCALGIPAAVVESVFPGAGHELPPGLLLELQQSVIDAAVEGLPVDLVLDKVREGRIKGATEAQLIEATRRMVFNIRSAGRIVDSVSFRAEMSAAIPAARQHMLDEVAQQLWRGLTEHGYLSLCETGRRVEERCDAVDLVAAGEVAVRLIEAGADHDRALEFARETIRRGYREQEMRQIQLMVVTCHQHGGGSDEFIANMEHCMNVDMGAAEMLGYMARRGWMGPGDVYNPGETPPVIIRGRGQGEMERGKRQGEGGRSR